MTPAEQTATYGDAASQGGSRTVNEGDTLTSAPVITRISKKSPTKFMNWRQYGRDMYVSVMRAGTGAFLAFAGTNTAEAAAPHMLHNIGMNWQQAVAAGISAGVFDLVRYVNLHPLPPESEESP